ncbi:unnamed protein product [Linum trigynum]|uniref:Uncharacterized protein n=1 Tax=Linum trigynum TaxID=586398 RepID=A0AAV2F8M5_9ROSI
MEQQLPNRKLRGESSNRAYGGERVTMARAASHQASRGSSPRGFKRLKSLRIRPNHGVRKLPARQGGRAPVSATGSGQLENDDDVGRRNGSSHRPMVDPKYLADMRDTKEASRRRRLILIEDSNDDFEFQRLDSTVVPLTTDREQAPLSMQRSPSTTPEEGANAGVRGQEPKPHQSERGISKAKDIKLVASSRGDNEKDNHTH